VVVKVLWKETALPRCRATDSRWNIIIIISYERIFMNFMERWRVDQETNRSHFGGDRVQRLSKNLHSDPKRRGKHRGNADDSSE